jgi:hypothetical protein
MRCYGADKNVALQIKIWDIKKRGGVAIHKITDTILN